MYCTHYGNVTPPNIVLLVIQTLYFRASVNKETHPQINIHNKFQNKLTDPGT